MVCTGPEQAAIKETAERTIITCRYAKTGFELALNLVAPKVGRMDVSPNAGASIIRLKAGAAGTPDSTDGGSSANLTVSTWEPGHRVGTFGMNWVDNAALKLKEGQFKGTFSL
jgi:hypothetical protein